ncbi:sugar MFS transporter [Actinotalea sp. Marseille-Q4924]|uniref:MFS transporter n=1 Tax=Actinotalea sp. Marseille-Q4924 TaxID=2866571 RepID=UPI001CE4514A|nr:MFS transporter [Actinotalea sp. Marseille-Q4924]
MTRWDALTVGLSASVLGGAMIQGGLGALLPYLGQDMPMTHTMESLHITGLATGGLVASALAEPARRRIGRGRVLVAGAALCAVGAVLLAVAPTPVLSAAAMLFVGIGLTSTLIAGQVLLMVLHGRRQGARMIGELNVSYSVGGVVAAALLPVVAAGVLGWRGFAVIPAALLALVVVPLVWLGVRRSATDGAVAVPAGTGHATGRARLTPVTMLLCVVVEWGFLFWLATHLTTVAGLSTADAARATGAMWLAVLVGRVAGSRLLGVLRPGLLLLGSLVLAVVATVALTLVTTPVAAVLTGVLAGLSAANLYAGAVAYVIEADPVRADAAVARGSLLSAVALIVAPLGLGVLADGIGLRTAYVAVAAVLLTAAFVMLAVTWPRDRRPASSAAAPDLGRAGPPSVPVPTPADDPVATAATAPVAPVPCEEK